MEGPNKLAQGMAIYYYSALLLYLAKALKRQYRRWPGMREGWVKTTLLIRTNKSSITQRKYFGWETERKQTKRSNVGWPVWLGLGFFFPLPSWGSEMCSGITSLFPQPRGKSDNLRWMSELLTVKQCRIVYMVFS